MQVLPIVYLGYMFISLYLLSFFLILYIKNRKVLFDYPKTPKKYTVSFVVPAYNEGKSIKETIRHIFDIGYPYLSEVIVVNDCSTDNTKEEAESLLREYPKLKLINNPKNLGNAARSQNVGLKYAKAELIAVVDGDSFPAKESINKMVGYFDDEKVGAVTCPVLVRNRNLFWEKIQAIEYIAICFGRKLLEYVDAIYVTPGPLALYRKTALDEIGGFDENNITQDIEATWHLSANGWKRKMCLSTHVSSNAPSKFKPWFVQRRRWNIGGLQCIYKYRKDIGRKGMLGMFIIPFFIINTFLGLLGLSIFFYLLTRRIISNFLLAKYSIVTHTPVITLETFYITPSILNYLGIVLFLFGLIYILLILSVLKERLLKKENLLNIPFYLIIYLMVYPFIMVNSLWHVITGKRIWR
ncbi:MAG: glycosyltransferase family 2 protein [Candidatus Nanoarchaeia archaeon]|nr:glycosyltransferase family 2 protein [Candidatus Nanoarchaeia archaeon]